MKNTKQLTPEQMASLQQTCLESRERMDARKRHAKAHPVWAAHFEAAQRESAGLLVEPTSTPAAPLPPVPTYADPEYDTDDGNAFRGLAFAILILGIFASGMVAGWMGKAAWEYVSR